MHVKLDGIELRLVRMPLSETFRTAHSNRDHRDVVVVRAATTDGPAGWAECVAENEPTYWPEYTAGALHVLEHHLVPRLLAGRPLGEVRGHQMAKAALEAATLDAGLRAEGRSLAEFLGADRTEVPTGIALGMASSIDDLVAAAVGWCDQGHRALKLKIAPGWDVEAMRAVRAAVGPDVALVVDANGSYRSDHPDDVAALVQLAHLAPAGDRTDRTARAGRAGPTGGTGAGRTVGTGGLVAIEQPFAPADLIGHAQLAGTIPVPVCLDESIGSLADVETALALGACGAVSLKAGRVGGLIETRRIHRRCQAEGVPLRCGGMLETGLGRALNLAVAALPGCTLPPDLGPSARYFSRDITPPHVDRGGTMAVPDGPGLGIEPLQEVLDEVTVNKLFLKSGATA